MPVIELKNGEYVVHKTAEEIKAERRAKRWKALVAIRPRGGDECGADRRQVPGEFEHRKG